MLFKTLYLVSNVFFFLLVKPDSRVIRTCGYEDSSYSNRCYQRSGFGGRQEVCACKNDFCNRSSSLEASIAITIAITFLAKLYL